MDKYSAIIVAAGSSRRMNGIDKIFYELGGKPVLQHSLEEFIKSELFSTIVVVTSFSSVEKVTSILLSSDDKDVKVVEGGKRRQDSVLKGLNSIPWCDYVVIHDGARPVVSQQILKMGIEIVKEVGAAIPVLPLQDTIKRVGSKSLVGETIDRNVLRAVQTPQFFDYGLIKEAHRLVDVDVADDSTMIELIGKPVSVFDGDPNNVKISTRFDLTLLEYIVRDGGWQ